MDYFAPVCPRVLILPGQRNLLISVASDRLDTAAGRATRQLGQPRKETIKLARFGDPAAVPLARIANQRLGRLENDTREPDCIVSNRLVDLMHPENVCIHNFCFTWQKARVE